MSDTSVLNRERPKLFIGVGGTGKQVLLQLRRMYLDKYGVPAPPHHGYISIDTDTQNQTIERREFDEFLQEVMFAGSNERVDTPIHITDVKRLYQNVEKYGHIFGWFDSKLQEFGEIKDGANQTRSFGRLAFYLHYDTIRRVLTDKITQLKTNITVNEARKPPFNVELDISGVDVWLAFSIAGGTGSGMFMDLSYLIRDCVPDQAPPNAIILLPTAFSNDYSSKYFANSYAALMELEYYNSPMKMNAQPGDTASNLGFRKWWVRDRADFGSNPVFQNTWLVGSGSRKNGGTFGTGDKTSLCGLIAEWLFVRVGGPSVTLAAAITSDTGNDGNALDGPFKVPLGGGSSAVAQIEQKFMRKYSAPGLSKVYIATQRLAAEAEHRLASDVLDDWMLSEEREALFGVRLDAQFGTKLMYAKNGDILRSTLARETANTSIGEAVRKELAQKCAEFRDSASSADVGKQIQEWVEKVLLDGKFAKDTEDLNQWGSYTRLIFDQNIRLAERQVGAALQEFIGAALQARRQRFGHAREGLLHFIKQFEAVAERMRTIEAQSDAQARDATQATVAVLAHLNDEKGHFTRSTIIKVAFHHIERRAINVLGKQVAQAGARVARRAADMIGPGRKERTAGGDEILYETGLIKAVSDLLADFLKAKDRLAARTQALKSQPESPANKRIDAPGEVDGSFYATDQGRPFTREDVARVSNRVLETGAVLGKTLVWDFRDAFDEAGSGQFVRKLLEAVKPDLRHISADSFDIVDLLNAQFDDRPPDAAYASYLRDTVNKGSPMLEEPTHETQKDLLSPPPIDKLRIARSDHARPAAAARLAKFVKNELPGGTQELTGPRDTIYVTSELVGIPLVMIPHLDEYRNRAYLPLVDGKADTPSAVVHTALDFEKFPDLLVLGDDQVRRQIETWSIFARAVALGVISGKRSDLPGSPIQWTYQDGPNWSKQTLYLGSLATAIRGLAADGSRPLIAIRNQLNAIMATIPADTLGKLVWVATRHANSPPVGAAGWIRANERIVTEYTEVDGAVSDSVRDRNRAVVACVPKHFRDFNAGNAPWAVESPPQSGFFQIDGANDLLR